MTKRRLNPITIVTIVLFSLGLFIIMFFVVTSVSIGKSVAGICNNAQTIYPGDCVDALILQVQDESASYTNRNHSVWALGQLGDKRALYTLERLYGGNIPDREKWDEVLSQYELSKAIKLLTSGINITSFLWR